jgi:hypothetical protein
MRKPELFKMACLRDILRLFAEGTQEPFFAGFGNRITDAMSYRSVGIPASKIYTIDSTGVVKTELLQAAGHKGSYIQLVSEYAQNQRLISRMISSTRFSRLLAPNSSPNTPTSTTGGRVSRTSLCPTFRRHHLLSLPALIHPVG